MGISRFHKKRGGEAGFFVLLFFASTRNPQDGAQLELFTDLERALEMLCGTRLDLAEDTKSS